MSANLDTERARNARWHALSAERVTEHFRVDPATGLDRAEAERRLAQTGPNVLATRRPASPVRMLLNQFRDVMILILVAAAVVSGFVGEPRDAIAIVVIVLLNAIVGVVQEYRAERALEAMQSLATPTARVRREDVIAVVPTPELVLGDIVMLEAGNRVPADLRLVDVHDLETDEAALTGESHTVEKQVEEIGETEAPLGDRRSLVFKGTVVTRGRAMGVTVATGADTELGKIAEMLRDTGVGKTPLQRRLARFGRRLALAVLAICATIFAAGLLRGEPTVLMFLTAVSLAVAAIPEALPAVITVALALGARKMVRAHALVRRLPAVETLGSVTYICSDKTGTLTENRMRVDFVQVGDARFTTLGQDLSDPIPRLGLALALNNDVQAAEAGRVAGDPTEVALYEFSEAGGFDKGRLEKQYPRIREVPFDSETKCMTTVHLGPDGAIAFVKGAPEAVVARCSAAAGQHRGFSGEAILQTADDIAREGYRVLAVATRRMQDCADSVDVDLEFIGLVALFDPPREGVEKAVAECRAAGITPVMITGDHPGTALAIAQRVGIADAQDAVLTGNELMALEAGAFADTVEATRVYARVDPAQKIRIVEALQGRGEFVAMTGDGVNDAPALKRADIGIAMGMIGTDVARESSDMVLMDDNFATIVAAVREGRRIYANILKFIKYTLTSNSGEIWTMFLAPFLGLPIPLLPIHILWINLVTDGLPGLALTAEKSERDLMRQPPRPPDQSIFSTGMWQHILWVGLLIGGLSILGQAWAIQRGSENWQTVVFTVLTFSQLAHVIVIRSDKDSLFSRDFLDNRPLIGAVALTILLQVAVIYVPAFQQVFNTAPLTSQEFMVCLSLPLVVLIGVELEKAIVRRGLIYQAKLP